PFEQVEIVRRVDGAHDAAELAHGLEFFGRANDGAGQQIVVPRQILGGRVEHVVDARLERTPVVGGGQCGVDQRFDAAAAADVGKLLQVDHAQVRVRGGLAHQQLRVRVDGRFHRLVVAGLHLPGNDAEPGEML